MRRSTTSSSASRVLVDDVQDLENLSACGLIELEVERPHVIGPLSMEPIRGTGRDAESLTLPSSWRHPEALLPPQPLDLLTIGTPALVSEDRPRLAITPALVLVAEGAQSLPLRHYRRCLSPLHVTGSIGADRRSGTPAAPHRARWRLQLQHATGTPAPGAAPQPLREDRTVRFGGSRSQG